MESGVLFGEKVMAARVPAPRGMAIVFRFLQAAKSTSDNKTACFKVRDRW